MSIEHGPQIYSDIDERSSGDSDPNVDYADSKPEQNIPQENTAETIESDITKDVINDVDIENLKFSENAQEVIKKTYTIERIGGTTVFIDRLVEASAAEPFLNFLKEDGAAKVNQYLSENLPGSYQRAEVPFPIFIHSRENMAKLFNAPGHSGLHTKVFFDDKHESSAIHLSPKSDNLVEQIRTFCHESTHCLEPQDNPLESFGEANAQVSAFNFTGESIHNNFMDIFLDRVRGKSDHPLSDSFSGDSFNISLRKILEKGFSYSEKNVDQQKATWLSEYYLLPSFVDWFVNVRGSKAEFDSSYKNVNYKKLHRLMSNSYSEISNEENILLDQLGDTGPRYKYIGIPEKLEFLEGELSKIALPDDAPEIQNLVNDLSKLSRENLSDPDVKAQYFKLAEIAEKNLSNIEKEYNSFLTNLARERNPKK